jgi:hypothetical protein
MPDVYSSAWTETRLDAVAGEFEMFLMYSGLDERYHGGIMAGVKEKWLSHVGVYLLGDSGLRILEAEINVDWEQHAELARLTPTIRTDLPGWKDGASPEIRVVGELFGNEAKKRGGKVHFWVLFTGEIRRDLDRHRSLCGKVGVTYQSSVPKWESDPAERSYTVRALNEVQTTYRHL